jgi:hypothetical protein
LCSEQPPMTMFQFWRAEEITLTSRLLESFGVLALSAAFAEQSASLRQQMTAYKSRAWVRAFSSSMPSD